MPSLPASCRSLAEKGYHVCNILGDGRLIPQTQIEEILLKAVEPTTATSLGLTLRRLDEAYRAQALKVAYRLPDAQDTSPSQHSDDP